MDNSVNYLFSKVFLFFIAISEVIIQKTKEPEMSVRSLVL